MWDLEAGTIGCVPPIVRVLFLGACLPVKVWWGADNRAPSRTIARQQREVLPSGSRAAEASRLGGTEGRCQKWAKIFREKRRKLGKTHHEMCTDNGPGLSHLDNRTMGLLPLPWFFREATQEKIQLGELAVKSSEGKNEDNNNAPQVDKSKKKPRDWIWSELVHNNNSSVCSVCSVGPHSPIGNSRPRPRSWV